MMSAWFLIVVPLSVLLQSGGCSLAKEEAAFRGAIELWKTAIDDGDVKKAIGQLTSVFQRMKDEIEYLRMKIKEETGTTSAPKPSGRKMSRNLFPWETSGNQWYDSLSGGYSVVAPTTTTTTTTTRRPKSTRSPEVRTLSDKEREMHEAAARGWDLSIAALCAEGISPNIANSNLSSFTPLHLAVLGRHLPAALTLIRCGANVNAGDIAGNTTLHYSVARGDTWMSGLLLLSRANPFLNNAAGRSAYQMALVASDPSFPTMFNISRLAWFSGVRRLNEVERTAREHVRNGYYLEVARLCSEAQLDPNVGDAERQRNTALHVAAASTMNQPMVVQTLVRCGANVNTPNLNGDTPLHVAVSSSNAAASAALLLHGADPFVANAQGQTPYLLGIRSSSAYIRELFASPRIDWYLSGMYMY